MITCSNCTYEAQFQYNISTSNVLYFCGGHLPRFLRGKTAAALLVSKVEAPAPKKKTTKKDAEPVVEEPVVEDSTEEPVEETDGIS